MARYYREFFTNPMIAFITAVAAVGLALTIATFGGWRTVLYYLLGMALYAVFEYAVHRYLLHEFPKLIPAMYKGHVDHHDHPNDIDHLFSPLRYDVCVYAGYFVALWAIGRDLRTVVAWMAGTALFQLYYQWMHYVAHRPITPITPWGKWMRKKHLLHHFMDEHAWYGVSHPAMDYLMGTHKPQRKPRNAGSSASASGHAE